MILDDLCVPKTLFGFIECLLPFTKWGRLNLSEISHVLDCPRVVGLKRLKGLFYERSIQQLVERDVDFRADYVRRLGHCGLGVCFPNS
jgi:hypothetical protein